MPPAQVAIVYPRSSFMWDEAGVKSPTTIEDETNPNMDGRTTEYMAEVHGLFALVSQTLNIPVDFIDEDFLVDEPSRLARFRVVMVVEPSMPVESQNALAKFAQSGGTVLLTRGAAMLDRYGQPIEVLGAGIDSVQATPTAIGSVWSLPNTANGTFLTRAGTAAAFAAFGQVGRASPKLPTGSTVLAKFADGSAAAVAVAPMRVADTGSVAGGGVGGVGSGGVIRLLWLPGLSWDHSGWLAGSGSFLRGVFDDAGVTTPAWTNAGSCIRSAGGLERGIETPLLIAENGAALTLLNWCGGNQTVEATALVGFTVGSVEAAVAGGSLAFRQDARAGVVSVNVTVSDVEVVVFNRKAD